MEQLLQWKSNKYYISQCVFAALGTHHAKRMRPVVIRGLSGAKIVFNILKNGKIFVKKNYCTYNVCFDFFDNFCLQHFSLYKELGGI